jgi:hypothetical protein
MNWLDLKIGGRMLVKYPGLTIVGGLAMAFAIWVGIVIFQVLGLFTNPTLPVSEGARLVEIRSMDVAETPSQCVLAQWLGSAFEPAAKSLAPSVFTQCELRPWS